nr:formin-like protein 14 [Ipomoea batatas]GMC54109.1 formin-like protein 14 [Ipomoea batatas]
MSLLSRFFYRRPPDGLLELDDRVYVLDSCFSTEVLPEEIYQLYLHEIITELHEEFPESSFLAFNFRDGEKRSQFAEILCEYDVTVMDYPKQYEGCPLLPLSLIHHFLRGCENWLSLGNHQNVILLHCERGGWPVLAFVLASFLVFKKLHSGERKTLEMVYREAPKGLLQLLSPLNPFPSQLRYLQYLSRRNISPEWPPPERALSLDCLILRAIPRFDSQKGCRPIVRIFGRNLLSKDGLSTQMLYSMPKKGRGVRHYRQKDSDVIKIDIQCLVQGDVVLECVHLDLDPEREVMMFRVMFNTAFIRSNILMLSSDNLDILWDSKGRYPKGFRAEVLFGDVESIPPPRAPTSVLNGEEKGGLPIEAFSMVQELFGGMEWVDPSDDAALWFLKQLSVLNDVKDLSLLQNRMSECSSPFDSEEENTAHSVADSLDFLDSEKASNLTYANSPDVNFIDDPFSEDFASDATSMAKTSEDPTKVSTEPFCSHPESNNQSDLSMTSDQLEVGQDHDRQSCSPPSTSPPLSRRGLTPVPPPPLPSTDRGRGSLGSTTHGKSRPTGGSTIPPKKASLKPLHWVKVTRAMQGSLWADTQKQESQSRAPEIDITELETLFSVASATDSINKAGGRRGSKINKPEKVQLNAILALDSSALDIDQVENLIKFCPTKEEMETLRLLAEKMPELLDFGKDLVHLEAASKIQLKSLAEEMQAVTKGLEKVEQELAASDNDGAISSGFHKVLKSFLDTAEADVRSLITLYSEVGRNADSLSLYFGEDPARCPFEQVTQTLAVFTKMFNKSRDENAQLADAERKKLEKEALKEQTASNSSAKKEADADKDLLRQINNRVQRSAS